MRVIHSMVMCEKPPSKRPRIQSHDILDLANTGITLFRQRTIKV